MCRSVQKNPNYQQVDVACDMIHDDGDFFGYARRIVSIPYFKGAVAVTDLAVYPLEYRDDKDVINDKAVAQGKLYMGLRDDSYREYEGVAIRDGNRGTFHVSRPCFASSLEPWLTRVSTGFGKSHD